MRIRHRPCPRPATRRAQSCQGTALAAHDGQILIMTAIAMFLLVGFLAAAIDVGMLLAQRRGAQNAVDAAALAVAHAMYAGVTDEDTLDDIAQYYVQQNGFNDTPTVTIDSDLGKATVSLSHNARKFFVGVVYPGPWTVNSTAVAALELTPKNYALLALSQQGTPIQASGNGNLNVVDGGAMSDGAMSCSGNVSLTADLTVDAHTGQYTSGNCKFKGTQGMSPTAPVVPNPLKSLQPPPTPSTPSIGTNAACTKSNNSYICPPGNLSNSGGVNVSGNNGSITFQTGDHEIVNDAIRGSGNNPTITFNPGTYYFKNSSISLSGNGSSLVFNPGTYEFYMDGGSMTFSGNSNGYQGDSTFVNFYFRNTEVTFSGNLDTAIPAGLYNFDGIGPTFSGNKSITGQDVFFYFGNGASWQTSGNTGYRFTAPSTNIYGNWYPNYQPHLLIYAQRTGSLQNFSVSGNSGILLDGIVYLPNAQLNLSGNFAGTWARGQLIVDYLAWSGNANAQVQYDDYVKVGVPAVFLIQ